MVHKAKEEHKVFCLCAFSPILAKFFAKLANFGLFEFFLEFWWGWMQIECLVRHRVRRRLGGLGQQGLHNVETEFVFFFG